MVKLTDKFDRQSNTTGNIGFAIARVPCFADTFVQGGSLTRPEKSLQLSSLILLLVYNSSFFSVAILP